MNNRYVLSTFLICLSLTVLTLLVIKVLNKRTHPEFPDDLPHFSLVTWEGARFSADSLSDRKIIVVFYSLDCLFCEHEGRDLARHSADFADCQLLFVTCAPPDSAAAYALRTGIGGVDYFYSLVDTTNRFPLLFGIRTTPTTLIYGRDRKLVKAFEGEVNAAKLLKTIQQNEETKE